MRYESSIQATSNARGSTIAQLKEPITCEQRDLRDVARLWRLFKDKLASPSEFLGDGGAIKVEIIIWGPKPLSLASYLKRLLDGFLSALHHRIENDTDLEEITRCMKVKYQWDLDQSRELLLSRTSAPLGHRRVPKRHVRENKMSLMWSPDDHRLDECHIVRKSSSERVWKVDARLFVQH